MRVQTCLLAAVAAMLLMMVASPRLAIAEPSTQPAVGLEKGNLAPEITGKDVHGKPMKLSDFRNKIVVIDFFGDW